MTRNLEVATSTPPKISKFLQGTSLSIVVAVLNERDNLSPFCAAINRLFQDYHFNCDVVIVNDGSTDGSQLLLQELRQCYDFLRVIDHPSRQGLTGVLQTATQEVDSEWLYLTAADLESDIYTDLPLLMEAYQEGDTAITGWRQDRRDQKQVASAIANKFCHLGFGLTIHDMNWVKLIRRQPLAALPLSLVTHRYIIPILSGLGCQIREVPVTWHARQAGTSKFGRQRLLSSGWEFTKLWLWFQLRGRWRLASPSLNPPNSFN